jgi:hypothetical protein
MWHIDSLSDIYLFVRLFAQISISANQIAPDSKQTFSLHIADLATFWQQWGHCQSIRQHFLDSEWTARGQDYEQ